MHSRLGEGGRRKPRAGVYPCYAPVTDIDLTIATSGRRPADALVLGAEVEAGKRVASIASIVTGLHA